MSYIVKKVVGKAAGKQAEAYEPKDPRYEYYTNAKGKKKRRQREIPQGLSKRDAKILKSVRKRAHRLDKGMSLCGLRVGWTFWLGIIPGVGDIADALLGYTLVINPASKCELPAMLRQRMIANQMLASGVGLIPLVGDVLMATIKPNSRNAWLLEEFLLSRLESGKTDNEVAQQTVTKTQTKGFWSHKTGAAAELPGETAGGSTTNGTATTSPSTAQSPTTGTAASPATAQQPSTRRVK